MEQPSYPSSALHRIRLSQVPASSSSFLAGWQYSEPAQEEPASSEQKLNRNDAQASSNTSSVIRESVGSSVRYNVVGEVHQSDPTRDHAL